MNYTSFDSLVGKKYAEAFIRVFGQDLVYPDLVAIESAQKFLSTHRRTLFFLQLPQFNAATKSSMIEDLLGYFSLPNQFLKLFLLLLQHNRAFYIPGVLSFVAQLYRERMNVISFSVMSSHPLNEKQREQIKYFLARSTGKSIACSYVVKKSLIAGIAMRSVDYMWEYSVNKQLLCLRSLVR